MIVKNQFSFFVVLKSLLTHSTSGVMFHDFSVNRNKLSPIRVDVSHKERDGIYIILYGAIDVTVIDKIAYMTMISQSLGLVGDCTKSLCRCDTALQTPNHCG